MGDILTLAKKLERAMRNDTGFNITRDELHAMAPTPIVDAIHAEKLKELRAKCLGKPVPTPSENGGSTSAATASPRTSGKPQRIGPEAAKSYIAQLSAGA
jgi:hypothetical protein